MSRKVPATNLRAFFSQKRKLDMTQADRSRRCYMSRKVPATNLRVFFSVISGITVIAIAAAPVIHGECNFYFKVIWGLLGTCLGGAIITDAFTSRSAMREMEKGRTKTLATVIDRYAEGTNFDDGNDGSVSYTYNIVFRFIAVEKEWTFQAMVFQRIYDKAGRDELSIIYADSDPRCVLFEGENLYYHFKSYPR
ncbi:MAG: hypothetical protein JRJ41_05975 [Deltaproteobacteria bacterium]|nr:hypothetical protein [Deltaproteobacteria bacterium]